MTPPHANAHRLTDLLALMECHDLDRRHVAEILGMSSRTVNGWFQASGQGLPARQVERLRQMIADKAPEYIQAKLRAPKAYAHAEPDGRDEMLAIIGRHRLSDDDVSKIIGVAPGTVATWRYWRGARVAMSYVERLRRIVDS